MTKWLLIFEVVAKTSGVAWLCYVFGLAARVLNGTFRCSALTRFASSFVVCYFLWLFFQKGQ